MIRLLIRLALLAVAAVALLVALPPRTAQVPPGEAPPAVRGAIHVHTRRSDGTGAVDDVLRAAARAGLQFLIVTDHGDGTRAPDPPAYRNGVLYIDSVEVSTRSGHVVALNLPQTPYPLGGDGRDVVEDIARLGGMSIAAHPTSTRAELRWRAWDAPIDGLEWLNGDSEWRDEPWYGLLRTLVAYPFGAPQALAMLIQRPQAVMEVWDRRNETRRTVAVAASDAHAHIGLGSMGEPYAATQAIPFPGYEAVLRTFSIGLTDIALSGRAEDDARLVLAALRAGHVFSTVDALAGPGAQIAIRATSGRGTAAGGDLLPIDGPVTITVEGRWPPEAQVTLLREGRPIVTGTGPLRYTAPEEPAVYRAEVVLPVRPGVPMLLTNPIYVGRAPASDTPAVPPAPRSVELVYSDGPTTDWRVEKNDLSSGVIDVVPRVVGRELLLRYALAGAPSTSPFVGFAMPVHTSLDAYDRLLFTARATRPMRISVQLRAPGGPEGRRWTRSVYVDERPRTFDLAFTSFAAPSSAITPPPTADIDSVLFVVDALNTRVGSNGQFWLDAVGFGR